MSTDSAKLIAQAREWATASDEGRIPSMVDAEILLWALAAALEVAEAQRDALVAAALALYERVEMDESVGICLSSRVEALNLRDALAAVEPPEEQA